MLTVFNWISWICRKPEYMLARNDICQKITRPAFWGTHFTHQECVNDKFTTQQRKCFTDPSDFLGSTGLGPNGSCCPLLFPRSGLAGCVLKLHQHFPQKTQTSFSRSLRVSEVDVWGHLFGSALGGAPFSLVSEKLKLCPRFSVKE